MKGASTAPMISNDAGLRLRADYVRERNFGLALPFGAVARELLVHADAGDRESK